MVWGEQKVREGVPSVLESQDFHIIHLETIVTLTVWTLLILALLVGNNIC